MAFASNRGIALSSYFWGKDVDMQSALLSAYRLCCFFDNFRKVFLPKRAKWMAI
jgi:hypothetical protein